MANKKENTPNTENKETQKSNVENTSGGKNKESAFEKKAKELFETYPKTEEFYFTSDGLAFFELCDAKNHASGLKEKEIKTVKK
jgi:hypothetical protein